MDNKILRFGASWCNPCKQLTANLERALKEVDNPPEVQYIDIGEDTGLSVEYGVRSIPVLVYLRDGNEIGRMQGLKTTADLVDWIEGKY